MEASAVAAPSKLEIPEHLQHKSRLQEFAQRSGLPPPFYQTVNEGRPHEPKFRAYVFIDGAKYESAETFLNRKAAEHDVAKIALENLSLRLKDESLHQISQDTMFCKSILMEFAVKMNLLKPTYTTTAQSGTLLPIFITTVVFDGKTYAGNPGKNKKEAEQIAARTVLQAILTSSSRTILSVMIKSKAKLYAALNQGGYPISDGNGRNVTYTTENSSLVTSAAVPHDIVPAAVPHDTVPAAVPHDTVPAAVPHDTVPAAVPHDMAPAAVPHDTVPAAEPCVPPSKKPKLELVNEKPKLELVYESSPSLAGNVTVGFNQSSGSGSVEPACDPQLSVSSGPSDVLPPPMLKKPSGELVCDSHTSSANAILNHPLGGVLVESTNNPSLSVSGGDNLLKKEFQAVGQAVGCALQEATVGRSGGSKTHWKKKHKKKQAKRDPGGPKV